MKVAFFQKVRFVFQISQINYSESLSWAWNLNKLFTVMGGNFKFQVQDSDTEYFILEIWKTNLTFWKKATFSQLIRIRINQNYKTLLKFWLFFKEKTFKLAAYLLWLFLNHVKKNLLKINAPSENNSTYCTLLELETSMLEYHSGRNLR